MSDDSIDIFCVSMKTGVLIEQLFPSHTTCPSSTCLSQPTFAEATVGKQFQQQHQQL